jgi:choline dehydrogenase-like flavoprotein
VLVSQTVHASAIDTTTTNAESIRPAFIRPSLQTLAKQVLFNEYKRAIGVQFDRFKLSQAIYARREVILSAGAINSPQLLLLSGVGPARDLQQLGVSRALVVIETLLAELVRAGRGYA